MSLLLAAAPVFAQRTGGQEGVQYNADGTIDNKPAPIVTEIVIPGTPVAPGEAAAGTLVDLAQYIGIAYNFLIGIIGMVAAVMIVIGGFQYLTSAGDSGKIGAAKTRIINALIGVVLALGAYTLLNTINPAMLTLKVPGGITGVRTEITFLPFCDNVAKQYGLTEEQIIKASTTAGVVKGMGCGQAGFIKSKIRNADGTLKDSRLWCLWRGNKALGKERQAAGEYTSDYGCADDTSIGGERVIGSMNIHALSVCAPYGGITQAQLNEEYDASKEIHTSLGSCISCNEISDGKAASMGWPQGDQSCSYWQNTANNGDPRDYDFKISKKKIVQDSRAPVQTDGHRDDHARRMYYCGYSASHQRCIYVPIHCPNIHECDNYDEEVMNYCEKAGDRGEITCHANQTLGTHWAKDTGNAAHLIPVCEGDPCEQGPKGCTVGGLAGTRNSLVGGLTSKVRVLGTVLTAGLTNKISCDAN